MATNNLTEAQSAQIANRLGQGIENQQFNSFIQALATTANNNLQQNPNYAANQLKMAQGLNTLQSNSQALQSNVGDVSRQIVDASRQAAQQQAASGIGNQGAAIFNSVNTDSSNSDILNQVRSASQSNRATLDTISLYDVANQSAIDQQIWNMIMGNDPTKGGAIDVLYGGDRKNAYNGTSWGKLSDEEQYNFAKQYGYTGDYNAWNSQNASKKNNWQRWNTEKHDNKYVYQGNTVSGNDLNQFKENYQNIYNPQGSGSTNIDSNKTF